LFPSSLVERSTLKPRL